MKHFKGKMLNLLLIVTLVMMNVTPVFAAEVSAAEETSAADLFISEYVEGSSYNKAIEIYNGTGAEVDLADYQIHLYSNGASEASQTLELSGVLGHGEVFVIAHSRASEEVLQEADLENGAMINFNGDDAFALAKNGSNIDVLGTIDEATDYAQDVTLTRQEGVTAPNSSYIDTEWDEYASNTFAYLGSHSMDGVPTDPPEDPEEPPASGEYEIAEARDLSDGTAVTVEGVVTADSEAISNGAQFSTYIQDATGGINLFAFEQGELPDLEKGDRVQVAGELDSYNGLKEVIPASVEILETGQTLPATQQITLEELQDPEIAEQYEGELVEVNGFINNIPESPAGGGYNVSLVDADFHGTTLRVMENALDISQVAQDKWYDITAVVSQYNDYQLIPTEQADIQLAEEQPEPPSAAGYYETTVERVTDGLSL